MIIDYFNVNKSNQSHCQKCKNLIEDKMRGVEETFAFGHKEYHYFCIKCSKKIITETKQQLHNLEKTLNYQIQRFLGKII